MASPEHLQTVERVKAALVAADTNMLWIGKYKVFLTNLAEAAIAAMPSPWREIDEDAKTGEPLLIGLHYGGRFIRYVGRWHQELRCWARDETATAIFPQHMQSWFTHYQPLPPPPISTSQG